MLSKRSVFSTAIRPTSAAAAADVDSLCRWTARPRRCAPVCWQNGHHDLIARRTRGQSLHPLSESSGVVLHAEQNRAGTVDQHATQINVAALADAEQLLLAPGGVLPWHDSQPSGEVRPRRKAAPLPMAATVAVETSRPKPGI